MGRSIYVAVPARYVMKQKLKDSWCSIWGFFCFVFFNGSDLFKRLRLRFNLYTNILMEKIICCYSRNVFFNGLWIMLPEKASYKNFLYSYFNDKVPL